ncbi:MAG: hypothetical protein HY815_13115 [Candidatus Riflebacteria bacterium]|nr:hypothetical protein [Candidatus Riflebacteria bacterium]
MALGILARVVIGIVVAAVPGIAGVPSTAASQEAARHGLPGLPARVLFVQRAFDPRMPGVEPATWEAAKKACETLFLRLFGCPVQLRDLGTVDPVRTFERHGVDPGSPGRDLAAGFLPEGEQRARYVKRVADGIKGELPDRIRLYLPAATRSLKSPHELAEAIVRVFEERARGVLEAGRRAATALGRGGRLLTMGAWGEALQRQSAADLIVTNVPVLYSHQDGSSIHALVRGGLIGGFATWSNRSRPHGGAALTTTHPLSSSDPAVRVAGGEALAPDKLSMALAAVMTHELAHLMFRLGDNYSHPGCVMHPPAGLDYHRFWFVTDPVRFCLPCNRRARVFEISRDARAREKERRLPEALALYRRTVECSPDDPEVLNDAAWFLVQYGIEPGQAVAWARKAVELSPGAAHIIDTLGCAQMATGDLRQAAANLELACRLTRESGVDDRGEIASHLAMAHLASGDYAKAAKSLGDAIHEGAGRSLLKTVLAVLGALQNSLPSPKRLF